MHAMFRCKPEHSHTLPLIPGTLLSLSLLTRIREDASKIQSTLLVIHTILLHIDHLCISLKISSGLVR